MRINKILTRSMYTGAVVGISIFMLTLTIMVADAWAPDDFDMHSYDAQIVAQPNSTDIWGFQRILNISDSIYEGYEHEKFLSSSRDDYDNLMWHMLPDGSNSIHDFNRMHERMDVPPEEYHGMYENNPFFESIGSGDYENTEYDNCQGMHIDRMVMIGNGNDLISNASTSISHYKPTATEEFSGEVVQLTGVQTNNIIWNASNFGGFCYNLNDEECIGTETLTILAGTLEGPDTDRIIDNTWNCTIPPTWHEYEVYSNIGLTVNGQSGYWMNIFGTDKYIAISRNPNKYIKPLFEFNSTDTKTLRVGENWDLGGGLTLTALEIDVDGKEVWFSLCENGIEIDGKVDKEGHVYTYTKENADEEYIPFFSYYVDAISHGTNTNIVQIKYAFRIEDEIVDYSLEYATTPIWHEYELYKNLGLTVKRNYYASDSGYWTEFWMGERYIAINGNASKLAKPLVEFNSTDTKTLIVGEVWDLGRGFTLTALEIDIDGGEVWLSLCKNGEEIESSVAGTEDSDLQDRIYTYTEDVAGEYDIPIFSCYVCGVIAGTDSNIVQVKYVFLMDNDILQITTGEYYDNMEVVSATSFFITLGNRKDLYLSQSPSTCQIMGNLSFKTIYNTSAIEFYPYLIRDELPVLSGSGGFISDCCRNNSWDLFENYTIGLIQVDLIGKKALVFLCKDGVVVDERILTEEGIAPVDSDCRYSYVKNGIEIINATLKAAFHGCNTDIVELGEVYQRSEVDGSILISNEFHVLLPATEPSGISWNLSDDYMFTVSDIGCYDEEVWLQLSKNGIVVKEKILNEDNASTFIYTSGIGEINCVVDSIFHGSEANAVKIVNVNQYSDVSGTALVLDGAHFFKSGDPDGMPWELKDGYVLTMKDINYHIRWLHNRWWHHVDDKVWLELSKDGSILKEEILKPGDLFEYKNGLKSFDCVVEAVFNGCLADVVKLKNVNQYSITGVQLIDNESKMYATADPIGDVRGRWEGYSLAPKDIDLRACKVWLSLLKDGALVKDAIITEDEWFRYYNSTGALVFSTYVETVFAGMNTNLVKVRYLTQYSEIDGRLFIEPDTESWQLQEGYYLTAQEIYNNNSVWLQLSKNNKLVDEGLFNDSFDLQNDTAGYTIVSGTINGHDRRHVQLLSITQYHETTGTVLTTWSSMTLDASQSYDDTILMRAPTSIPKTITVNDSGGADYTSIQVAINASNSRDTIIVYSGTYHENIIIDKQLTLIGIDMPVVDGGREDSTIKVTADDCTIDGFRVVRGYPYGIFLYGSASSTLQNNEMVGNKYNLGIYAWSLDGYTHNINTSNTVNGKPVYYLVDRSNIVIDSSTNAGFIGVVNSSNIVVTDLTIENNCQGVLFAYTSNSRIENVNTSDNRYGMYLFNSVDNTLTNNRITDNYCGMYLSHSVDNTLTNNHITDNYDGMCLQESSNNVISDNNVSCNEDGINLDSSSYNSLSDNLVNDNLYFGIYVYGSEDDHYNNYIYTTNTVNGKPVYYYYGLNNQIIQNLETTHLTVAGSTNVVIMNNNISGGDGIHLACSGSSTIRGNTISNNYCGIRIRSSNDEITGNTISNNSYGVYVYGYSSNQIQNNILTDQYYGIYLSSTSNNTVSGNTISNSRYNICMYYSSGNTITTNNRGLWVDGWQDYHFNNYIDTSNTVNGKPVYYYYNIHNQVINNLDASHLTVACSSDITIADNSISGGDGIRLVYTNDSTVSTNTVKSNCRSGIYLDESYRNEFIDNTILNNDNDGVYLYQSSNNKFIDNMISSNHYDGISLSNSLSNEVTDNIISNNDDNGISLRYSQSNILSDNELYSNRYGIKLYDSQRNTMQHNSILGGFYGIYLYNLSFDNCLYRNNLMYNTYTNAYDCDSNYWYNGTTGNYWDDYIGMDADDDGIGDIPYNISGGNNQDTCPLMTPYNWEIPEPKTIYVDDDSADDPVNHKWNTIGEGLGDAFYNDTIIVYNGIYSEDVQISIPIKLVGIGMPVMNHSSIRISANRCILDGFSVNSGTIRIYSDENTITNNTVSGNYRGIYLSSSSNNTLKNNAMMDFKVNGNLLSDYTHDIDTSNTVNGKPVYYLVNASNQIIDSTSNAGYVGVINSSGIIVRDLSLKNNTHGVLFYYTNNSKIENVSVSDSEYGIMLGKSYGNYVANSTINSTDEVGVCLFSSSNNTLRNNIVNSTGEFAVYLDSSSNNTLKNNTVNSTGEVAVYLDSSSNNTLRNNIINSNYLGLLVLGYNKESYNNFIDSSNILNSKSIFYYYNLHDATIQDLDTTHLTIACSDNVTIKNNNIIDGDIVFLPLLNNSTIIDNTVQDNYYGIFLWDLSNNNTLYHNNFINNTRSNASDEGSDNQWDDGTEGNYHSDYTGTDSNGDGIGDIPYPIPGGNSEDRYPLIAPWNP